MKNFCITLIEVKKDSDGYFGFNGKLKIKVSEKSLKLVNNKMDSFEFNVIGTILTISNLVEMLKNNKKGNCGLAISTSGQPDEQSIGIEINKYTPNLEINIYEIFSANKSYLMKKIEIDKDKFLEELNNFLEKIVIVSKENKLYEELKKEIKKINPTNSVLKKLLNEEKNYDK